MQNSPYKIRWYNQNLFFKFCVYQSGVGCQIKLKPFHPYYLFSNLFMPVYGTSSRTKKSTGGALSQIFMRNHPGILDVTNRWTRLSNFNNYNNYQSQSLYKTAHMCAFLSSNVCCFYKCYSAKAIIKTFQCFHKG